MNSDEDEQYERDPAGQFAGVTRRGRAIIIDYALGFVFFFGSVFLFSNVDLDVFLKFGIVVFLLVGLEPLLVTMTGASIGQHMLGMRVERVQSGKNLNIFQSLLRFALKSVFGVWSLFLMLTTRRYQALHDFLSGSVVVIKDSALERGVVGYPEQVIEEANYRYPYRFWRIVVILIYMLLAVVGLAVVRVMTELTFCGSDKPCLKSDLTMLADVALLLVILAAWLWVIKYGWRGRLFGARRKALPAVVVE